MNRYMLYKAKEFEGKHKIFRDEIPFLFMTVIKHFKVKNIWEWYNALIISKRLSKWLKWLDYVALKYLPEAQTELWPAITVEKFKYVLEEVLVFDFMTLGDTAEKIAIQYFEKQGYKEIQPHKVGLTMAAAETMGIDAFLHHPVKGETFPITVKNSGFDTYKFTKEKKQYLIDRMIKYNIKWLVIINLYSRKGKLYTAEEFANRWNLEIKKEDNNE